MQKKAILVVSFGTSRWEALEQTIFPLERALAAGFPDRAFFRAFTSSAVIRRLRQERDLDIDDVPRALERLGEEGFADVLIQPTHVVCGAEWEKLQAQAAQCRFPCLRLGLPLLSSDDDLALTARTIVPHLPPAQTNRAIVFLGHGTSNAANNRYRQLQQQFLALGRRDLLIGTMHGEPDAEEVCRMLRAMPQVAQVQCRPLMICAGAHAQKELAGEGPDSWRSILLSRGYGVECVMEGLGQIREIQALLLHHAGNAQCLTSQELD